jgi:hypothetical protein
MKPKRRKYKTTESSAGLVFPSFPFHGVGREAAAKIDAQRILCVTLRLRASALGLKNQANRSFSCPVWIRPSVVIG